MSTFLSGIVFFCPFQKCVVAHMELFAGGAGRKGAGLPLRQVWAELRRRGFGIPTEFDASGFRGSDALLLPLADELMFRLRHIGQKLQDDVRNQRPG